MSADQKAALVDAALSSRDPTGYLIAVSSTLGYVGRDDDARLAYSMARLASGGEADILKEWREGWLNGVE